MTNVYDVDGVLAVRGGIEKLVEGVADYNIFFSTSSKEAVDQAIRHGYEEAECFTIYVEVKNVNNEKAISKQS